MGSFFRKGCCSRVLLPSSLLLPLSPHGHSTGTSLPPTASSAQTPSRSVKLKSASLLLQVTQAQVLCYCHRNWTKPELEKYGVFESADQCCAGNTVWDSTPPHYLSSVHFCSCLSGSHCWFFDPTGCTGEISPWPFHCAEAAKDMKNTTALLGRLLSSGGLCTRGLCDWFSCFSTLKAVWIADLHSHEREGGNQEPAWDIVCFSFLKWFVFINLAVLEHTL